MAPQVPTDWRERAVLTVPEAGRVVGLGRSAAYDAVARGELPTIRFGERRVVVPVAALRRMLGELVDDRRSA